MAASKKYKILCFTDNETGRDVEMILPIRYFAEKFLNVYFIHAFVYDVFAVYREKPDIVFLPNTVGSPLYYEISKYANRNGIPVFALTSEGNFRTDGSFNYWGYNLDKMFYQEFVCLWSSRTVEFLKNAEPFYEDRIVLTGGTGFDRYKIYDFPSKKDYLARKNLKSFKKVIGYAGWAFGKLYNKQGEGELLFFFKNDVNRLKWAEKQRQEVEQMLRSAIENNPDILFILKKHPNEENPSIIKEGLNEMNKLLGYDNVLYIKDEENIHDLISISDIWFAFESTTAIEAWLMGKQTFLLNPDPDFFRDALFEGSVILRTPSQLQNTIEEFYRSGQVPEFFTEEKKAVRDKIIQDTIGFGDGCNHIRACFYLMKTIELSTKWDFIKKRKSVFSMKYFIMYLLMHMGSWVYNKKIFRRLYKFKKTIWIFERFRLLQISVLYKKYSFSLENFYQKKNIKSKFERNELFGELLDEKRI